MSTPPVRGPVLINVKPLRYLPPWSQVKFTSSFTPMYPPSTSQNQVPAHQHPPATPAVPAGEPSIPPTNYTSQNQIPAHQPPPATPAKPAGDPSNTPTNYTSGVPETSSTPLQTPPPESNAPTDGGSRRRIRRRRSEGDGSNDTDGSRTRRNRERPPKNTNTESRVEIPSPLDTPREQCAALLSIYDFVRRRLNQRDEANNGNRNSHIKASTIMTDNQLNMNVKVPIGPIPGVEVGDIYYFRFEMIVVGLHVQVMSGIDTLNNKTEQDRVAISVVASGEYDDESEDSNVLVYSGQGGNNGKADQKLESANLAMEMSVHNSNPIRVIRGIPMKTINGSTSTGKIYFYDGLYKIDESWMARSKEGCKVFKFKMLREPGQPEVYAMWKTLDQWRRNPGSRGDVVTMSDLSSGMEKFPVCVVNEIDADKEPDPFSYLNRNLYVKSRSASSRTNPEPQGCSCAGSGGRASAVCSFSNPHCHCLGRNDGYLPYSSNGILALHKPVIYECSSLCRCSSKCPNRLTQGPPKLHFEVFKTKNTGWGLRSWDPIRGGTFVCEYTGAIIEMSSEYDVGRDRFLFDSGSGNRAFRWNTGAELISEETVEEWGEETESFVMTAREFGNVSRFINHSCTPNLFWQLVQQEHGEHGYPHVMFFAVGHIPPMTELTFDYGSMGRRTEKCLCETESCRGVFG